MSQYGPPGGPYPGQPQDPWQSGSSPDPLDPSDPYGYGASDPFGYGYQQQYAQEPRHAPYPGHQPPPAQRPPGQRPLGQRPLGQRPAELWGPPVAPPRRGGSGLVITLIVVLAVLLCGGAGIAIYAAARDRNGAPTARQTPSPNQSGQVTQQDAAQGALNAKEGDCMENQGTETQPRLRKVRCGKDTLQVIQRIPATSDVSKCAGTPDYTHHYFYKTDDERNSLVLCMKLLER